MENPGYDLAQSPRSQARGMDGMMNPGYDLGGGGGGGGREGYAVPDGMVDYSVGAGGGGDIDYVELSGAANPGDEGFITTSKTSFNPKDKKAPIKGVTFEPCQTDEWFFMGLSNITQNHHGKKDQHYDVRAPCQPDPTPKMNSHQTAFWKLFLCLYLNNNY